MNNIDNIVKRIKNKKILDYFNNHFKYIKNYIDVNSEFKVYSDGFANYVLLKIENNHYTFLKFNRIEKLRLIDLNVYTKNKEINNILICENTNSKKKKVLKYLNKTFEEYL